MYNVKINVIIPTLGKREYVNTVISTLHGYSSRYKNVSIKIFVSINQKDSSYTPVEVVSPQNSSNFSVHVIKPPSYQPSTETHLLWCLRWYLQNINEPESYVWPLTDNDPLIAAGFDAVIDFLRVENSDIFLVNNIWGDTLGQALPSPSYPVNKLVWHGSASTLFRSSGFEHATSNIGGFFIRSSFISEHVLILFEKTILRAETCAHAWWLFEIASSTNYFFLLSTPIVMNKFNVHHFDHSSTWKENAERNGVCSYHDWIVGYLSHFDYYIKEGLLSYEDIRTAMISEPQRGIVIFLNDILRRIFMQAKLALVDDSERFAVDQISLIKKIFNNVYPLRSPMINDLCTVLSLENLDSKSRLLSYKHAISFRAVEESQGEFSILFRNAFHGYYIFEHVEGFVAVLNKSHIYKAYRDIDPVDIYPFILYSRSEKDLLEKIVNARVDVPGEILVNNLDYFAVTLREHVNPVLRLPDLQLIILSKSDRVSGYIVNTWRFFRRVSNIFVKIKRLVF